MKLKEFFEKNGKVFIAIVISICLVLTLAASALAVGSSAIALTIATNYHEQEDDEDEGKGRNQDESKSEDDEEDDADLIQKAKITEAEAIIVAEKAYAGYSFTSNGLENEDGIIVYNLEGTKGDTFIRVNINAVDGSIMLD